MASDDVLGSLSLTEPFDFCIIGSGAGGGTAAHVLTAAGKSVLVLEAGGNPFPGLDQSAPLPFPLRLKPPGGPGRGEGPGALW